MDLARYSADWYPDPTGRFEFRYHNGHAWTGDVSVDGERFIDQLRDQSPVGPRPADPPPASRATAAMVLAIAAVAVSWVPFLFALGAVSGVLALIFGIPALRRARRAEPPDRRSRGFALTAVILAPIGLALCSVGLWLTALTYREVDRYTNVGDYSIEESACIVNDGVATYSGTITNESGSTRSYRINTALLRPDTENVLYREGVDVADVSAGASSPWSVNVVVREDSVDCTVSDVTGPLPFGQR